MNNPTDIPAEERKRLADDSPLNEREVKKIVQTIQQVSSAPVTVTTADKSPAQLSGLDEEGQDDASYYWDASTVAPLNPASAAAIARLRAFKPPPFPLWDRLPVSRRAAVLMLLYADRRGDLRVVITMRAASLRSFSGHAALPGGKADTLDETPYQIARREAWEEIGLPMDDAKIPAPFRIEHLCYLPFNLAKTELVVRPCVALLHTTSPPVPTGSITASSPSSPSSSSSSSAAAPTATTVEESLIPRLDAREVAAVFSAPFHNFLCANDEPDGDVNGDGADPQQQQAPPAPATGRWYEGSWVHWHEQPWRLHHFYVPVDRQRVARPRVREGGLAALDEGEDGGGGGGGDGGGAQSQAGDNNDDAVGRFKVWGMTARIIVDAATVAYGEEPEFEHNSHFGDEAMIEGLDRIGRLGEKRKAGSELTGEDMRKASEAAKM